VVGHNYIYKKRKTKQYMKQEYNHFRAKKQVDLDGFLKRYIEGVGPTVQGNCSAYMITNQELIPNQPHYGELNDTKITPVFSKSHTKPLIPLDEFLTKEFTTDELSQLMLLFETRIRPEIYTCSCGEGVSAIYLSELHKNPIVSIPKIGGARYAEEGIENAVGELEPTKDLVYIPRLEIIT